MKPDIYTPSALNTERIAKYRKLAEDYNIDEGTVRDIFCKGADWGIEVSERKPITEKPICFPNECDHPTEWRSFYENSSWCNKCWSYVDLPPNKSPDKCRFYDCAQGRHKCTHTKVNSPRCTGVCDKYEE